MDQTKKQFVLIGDVGGTNVRLALFDISLESTDYHSNQALKKAKYNTQKYETFFEFVQEFVQGCEEKCQYPTYAVIGIAGAIYENKSKLANTNWCEVDGQYIGEQLKIYPFLLINDFHSLSYGVLQLQDQFEFLESLNHIQCQEQNRLKIVTGPGTGLGLALLIPQGDHKYQVWPTEGGHGNFSPANEIELAYYNFRVQIQGKNLALQQEHAMAGQAIPYMYFFIKSQNPEEKSIIEEELNELKFDINDPLNFPSEQVIQRGIKGDDPICRKVLELFLDLYENMLGDIILRYLPLGGIYLFGGLTISISQYWLKRAQQKQFMIQYKMNRPYFEALFKKVPIYMIKKPELGLEGAYCTALILLKNGFDKSKI